MECSISKSGRTHSDGAAIDLPPISQLIDYRHLRLVCSTVSVVWLLSEGELDSPGWAIKTGEPTTKTLSRHAIHSATNELQYNHVFVIISNCIEG